MLYIPIHLTKGRRGKKKNLICKNGLHVCTL